MQFFMVLLTEPAHMESVCVVFVMGVAVWFTANLTWLTL